MKTIYKLEIFAAIIGIFVIGLFLLPTPPTFTGYVSGLNLTIYSQNLDVLVDGSQSYTLTTGDGNLHLKSFMLDGEVIGQGRAEILLDNGKGQQLMIYENVQKKPDYSGPQFMTGITASITGKSISDIEGVEEKQGVYLVMQPKNAINYEFLPLKEDEEIVPGEFYSVCKETCNMPKFIFNSHTYELVFRLERGTSVKLKEIKYILQENQEQ
jgi:hypothetical protein